MNPEYEKQFLVEQRIEYQTLKALVQRKNQIRINFSNSRAYCQLQMELKTNNHQQILTLINQKKPSNMAKSTLDPKINRVDQRSQRQEQSQAQEEDLFEVIKRQNNRLAAFGRSEQKPLVRNSIMSRTYRKRKTSDKCLNPNLLTKQTKPKSVNMFNSIRQVNQECQNMFLSGLEIGNKKSAFPTTAKIDLGSHFMMKKTDFQRKNLTPTLKNEWKEQFSKEIDREKLMFGNNFSIKTGKSALSFNPTKTKNFNVRRDQKKRNLDMSSQSDQSLFINQSRFPLTSRNKRKAVKVSPPSRFKPPRCASRNQKKDDKTQIKAQVNEDIEVSCRPWTGNKNVEEKPIQKQDILEDSLVIEV